MNDNPFYSIEIPREPTGIPELDRADRHARTLLIRCLERGDDPQIDKRYQKAEARVTELKRRYGLEGPDADND